MCISGKAALQDDKKNGLTLYQGQTVLIPAETRHITITPEPQTKLIETYI
jgi:mannose-6-phosphate isomerase